MLKSWAIENFKSIKGRVSLDLAGLTIFAGANSSGKSTVIQSILLVKQTLQDAPVNRPLALNGPILKLGRFDDVHHINSTEPYVSFGCSYDGTVDAKVIDSKRKTGFRTITDRVRQQYSNISFESHFGAASNEELDQLQPYLMYSRVQGAESEKQARRTDKQTRSSDSKTNFLLEIERKKDLYSASHRGDVSQDMDDSVEAAYCVLDSDRKTKAEAYSDYQDVSIVGARPAHFLPYTLLVEYDSGASLAARVTEIICSLSRASSSRIFGMEDVIIPGSVVSLVYNIFMESNLIPNQLFDEDRNIKKEYKLSMATAVIERLARRIYLSHSGHTKNAPSVFAVLQENANRIELALLEHFGSGQKEQSIASFEGQHLSRFFRDFFVRKTKYLGPLRDEPRPLYPLEALSNPRDVGYRGEHTAAVLELHRSTPVSYIDPEFITGGLLPKITQEASLHDAAVAWLSYLGVAEDIKTSDKGKFGHEMQVRAYGIGKAHDLTNVGVGVSQVLPIVIMALLAESDSLLIFEQPELHLHPKVQSRLADFFLSLTLQGKQCIVETHSEYMVHRLRRRVAESSDDSLRDLLKLYFVQHPVDHSIYTNVEISRYGAITDWPDDFFDQSDREIEQILLAARGKRNHK